jgi:hypothetical protein
MLDIQLLRKDIDAVAQRLATRGFQLDVALFQALEAERKQLQTQTEDLQARRNSLSKQIGMLKGKGEDASGPMAEVAGIGDTLKASAQRLAEIQDQISDAMLSIPNLPHESVPTGKDETENVEVRRVGTPRTFDFEIKDHVDVGARSASISRRPRRSLARASPSCVAAWHACIARWSSSWWTRTRWSTATPRCTCRTSSMPRRCAAPASCRSSRTTCSRCRARSAARMARTPSRTST